MFTSVAQANAAVIEQIRRARPHWLDVQPASSLISELNEGKTLLHAGPPMCWQEMTGPMKGACVGACLFEGWAKDEAQALAMLDQGEVNFIPCHHVNAVGPMGGITSASMPMLVVENVTDGNRAYCNLNEGIGKVMRFGAYGEDVLTRHRWMRDVLMPVLSAALGRMERGIDLTAMMAQGITMGDEFHQRNIASSALLMRTLAPQIARLDHDKQHIAEVMDFLSVTDQFFLNLAMAYCKAAMDAGAMIRSGRHRHGYDPQRQYVRDSGQRAGRTLVYCACKHSPRSVFSPVSRRSRRTRIWAIAQLPKPLVLAERR
ncbi:putative cytoplasmic protein [Escherichia coli]|uniref:Putative cytoplasmic protein n=1 Tax=Escherichia coli TaxID=562 RepID=A0A3S4KHA8_ECOLX|nr:putative cytoplasmic protein [Escherichia coli]